MLSTQSGTVEPSGIAYFCEATQQIGDSMQENLYIKWSVDDIFRDCLAAVRSAEDIEDEEELDGVVRRPWLSQFEFTKMFTAAQAPKFLAWVTLYHKLPSLENGTYHHFTCCLSIIIICGYQYNRQVSFISERVHFLFSKHWGAKHWGACRVNACRL